MTTLGYLKSIIIYQLTLDPNVVKANELLVSIEKRYFDPTFYENGNKFFNNILKTLSFTDISKDSMVLYLKKIQNINTSIDSFFYTKPSTFTEEEIQTFYVISALLNNKVTNVINNLTIENISISKQENEIIKDIQNRYRDYIVNLFFRKYIEDAVSSKTGGDSNIGGGSNTLFSQRKEYIKWDIEIIYNEIKRPHCDYVFHQVCHSKWNNKNKKLGILYFMKNIEYLPKIENYIWSHNMIVKEYDAKYDYAIRGKNSLYNIRYDLNNVKKEDLKRIFIYGYSLCRGVKIFVGFAYYTTEHFRQISPKYLSKFSVW